MQGPHWVSFDHFASLIFNVLSQIVTLIEFFFVFVESIFSFVTLFFFRVIIMVFFVFIFVGGHFGLRHWWIFHYLYLISELDAIVTSLYPRCLRFRWRCVLQTKLTCDHWLFNIWDHIWWFHERKWERRSTVEVCGSTWYRDFNFREMRAESIPQGKRIDWYRHLLDNEFAMDVNTLVILCSQLLHNIDVTFALARISKRLI